MWTFSSLPLQPDNNVTIAKSGPIAVAGPDQIVKEGSTVTLNGSQSVDPDGIILSYSWRQIPTNHIITLNGANTPVWSFTAPKVSSDTTFTFELTVTDNNGTTNNRTVNVLVKHSPSTSDQLAPPPSIAGVVPPQTPLTNNPQPIEGTTPTPIVDGNSTNNPPIVSINPQPIEGTTPTPIVDGNSTNNQLAPPPSIAGVVPPQTPLTNNPRPIEGTTPTPIVDGNSTNNPPIVRINPQPIEGTAPTPIVDGNSTNNQLAPPPSIAGVVPPQTPLTNNPQPIEGTTPTPIVDGNSTNNPPIVRINPQPIEIPLQPQ